jgi:hypothetical protein
VDASGNVVVTASSYNGPPNYDNDYYTAKYAAADGALLWEKRYDGPAHGSDVPSAVAVDGSGNVVVTGQSGSSSSERDYYTVKYAAADGALLWEKRYNGPANGDEIMRGPHSLALGPNGMVAITGASDGAFDPTIQVYDYATVVYRELPSAPLLSIARSNALVIVSWPSPSTGFVLQQNTDLNPANWTTPSESVTDNSTIRFIIVNPPTGNRYYRLFKP